MFYHIGFALLLESLLSNCMNTMNRTVNDGSMTITAWNMKCSFRSANLFLYDLMNYTDIIALSEHALYPCEHYKFEELNPDFEFCVKSYSKLNDINFGKQRG